MNEVNTRTTTANTTAPQHFVWPRTNAQPAEIQFKTVAQALRQIRSRYVAQTDELSTDLKDWIDRFSTFVDRGNPTTLGEAAHLARKEFDILKDILRNIFAPDRTVETPLWDGQFLWDESSLNDYLQLYHISPFDGTTRLEARPHPFCAEVIQWMKSLPLDGLYQAAPVTTARARILRNFASATPPLQKISSQSPNEKLELYLLYAEQAVAAKKIRNQNKKIAVLSTAIRTTIPRAEEGIRVAIREMRASNEAHHRKSNMRNAALEEMITTGQTVFNGALLDKDQQIGQLNYRQTLSEAQIKAMKEREAQFEAQLASQNATIAALSNQVNNSGGGNDCTIL